jgi:hypothetical protein
MWIIDLDLLDATIADELDNETFMPVNKFPSFCLTHFVSHPVLAYGNIYSL